MDVKQTLIKLAGIDAVSGREKKLSEIIGELAKPYASSIETDNSGNLLVKIKDGKPMLMLEAHIDQIGLIVTYIDDSGFLRVSAVGGVDRRMLLAKPVTVHGKREVPGIIATLPPHAQNEDEGKRNPKIEDIFIDTGMSKEDVQVLISPGDTVTFDASPYELMRDKISYKSFDNRAGAAAVLKAIEIICQKDINTGLCVAFTVQEELGKRGASAAAFSLNPDIAVSIDVSFALTPDSPGYKCGIMGHGPMIGIAPTLDKDISDRLKDIAEQKIIPYQAEIMNGETGTNADAVSISSRGVKTGLLSIPLKYMHTPIETISPGDVEDTARLLAEFVLSIK